MKPEHDAHDTLGHERRLAEALGALVQQIDVSDYRDAKGHPAKNNVAFLHAQALVDEFGISHEDICSVLDTCGEDMGRASRMLSERMGNPGEPGAQGGERPSGRAAPPAGA